MNTGFWKRCVNAFKNFTGIINSNTTYPEALIRKSFISYLSILDEAHTILQEEQIPSISNQVLQWFSLVQSYVNSKCSSQERYCIEWEKIEGGIIKVNFQFLILFLHWF